VSCGPAGTYVATTGAIEPTNCSRALSTERGQTRALPPPAGSFVSFSGRSNRRFAPWALQAYTGQVRALQPGGFIRRRYWCRCSDAVRRRQLSAQHRTGFMPCRAGRFLRCQYRAVAARSARRATISRARTDLVLAAPAGSYVAGSGAQQPRLLRGSYSPAQDRLRALPRRGSYVAVVALRQHPCAGQLSASTGRPRASLLLSATTSNPGRRARPNAQRARRRSRPEHVLCRRLAVDCIPGEPHL